MTQASADSLSKKLKTYVRAAGPVIAWQTVFHQTNGNMIEGLVFEHLDASAMSRRMTDTAGATITTPEIESSPAEFDATGNSVGLDHPYPDMNTLPMGVVEKSTTALTQQQPVDYHSALRDFLDKNPAQVAAGFGLSNEQPFPNAFNK